MAANIISWVTLTSGEALIPNSCVALSVETSDVGVKDGLGVEEGVSETFCVVGIGAAVNVGFGLGVEVGDGTLVGVIVGGTGVAVGIGPSRFKAIDTVSPDLLPDLV